MKELKDLIAGDAVLVTGRYHRHIAKVDKVTKTQIIANNARFRRDSGWQCGGDRWNVKSISVPTEKEISDIKEENLRKTLGMFYGKVNVDGVEIDRFTEVVGVPVLFKKTNENAVMPSKAHGDDFCYDCYAVSEEEVAPNVWKYGLGFALQIEDRNKPADISRCFTFRPRSSVWKTGMILSNSEGTIDDSYTGEISAVFYHVMPNMPRYKVGDKIVQFHLETSDNIMFVETDELNKTERGDNGYGSSDKK